MDDRPLRYVIYGAGAVGSVVGAGLFRAGKEVVLIARGEHLSEIQRTGLLLETAQDSERLRISAIGSPSELDFYGDDVVILAMKSQDTELATRALRDVAPATITVACAQNGVDNERMAVRRFTNVYGLVVMVPATFLEPGIVQSTSAPTMGVLDVGRYPSGVDGTATALAGDLEQAGFSSRAVTDIMRWKYTKLVANVRTAVSAFCAPSEARDIVVQRAADEVYQCYTAAGIDYASDDEVSQRRGDLVSRAPIPGRPRPETSSFQSLARGVGTVESDYFSGEVALMGRLHSVDCSVNAAIQELSAEQAFHRSPPGLADATVLLERAKQLSGAAPLAAQPMGAHGVAGCTS